MRFWRCGAAARSNKSLFQEMHLNAIIINEIEIEISSLTAQQQQKQQRSCSHRRRTDAHPFVISRLTHRMRLDYTK